MKDQTAQFESRKKDHLRIALSAEVQTPHLARLDRIQLRHEALPDLNFSDIDTSTEIFGRKLRVPFLISSMTAGTQAGVDLNLRLAKAAAELGWAMGVGSQRRELFDPEAKNEWRQIRKVAPQAVLLGNLGIAQVISTPVEQIQALVDNLEAQAFFVHLNSLQEAMQPEGNLNFTGSFQALEKLTKALTVPVVVKETGCGFSVKTLRRLNEIGIAAVDVAGAGGTHWGRVEGQRSSDTDVRHGAAKTFENWGYSTVDSLLNAREAATSYPVWASGGVRSGLDAAKLLALGAQLVGFAQPILAAALTGEAPLRQSMQQFEFELKTALFCTGLRSWQELSQPGVWTWI